MTRLRGRAPRGRRLHAAAPCGRWQSTTMISSIRLDGTTACMHLPGAADTAAFVTYLEQVLCPTLKPGDIVVMDNLSVHKSPEVERLVRRGELKCGSFPLTRPISIPLRRCEARSSTCSGVRRPAHPCNSMRRSAWRSQKSQPKTPWAGLPLAVIVLFKTL